MSEFVELQVDQGLATITINRPERMNALTPGMIMDLTDIARDLAGDPDRAQPNASGPFTMALPLASNHCCGPSSPCPSRWSSVAAVTRSGWACNSS